MWKSCLLIKWEKEVFCSEMICGGGGSQCKTGEIQAQNGFTAAANLEQTCSLYRLTSGPTALRVNSDRLTSRVNVT